LNLNCGLETFMDQGELLRQARVTRALGSPFVSAILESGQRHLGHAPHTEALISRWSGDPASAALAMRFNAALHALARRGNHPELSALYAGRHDDFDGAVAMALAAEDDFVAAWMRHPPQTNEVGRTAAISLALMVLQRRFGLPFELLELGSSCGLNLNLALYEYRLGEVATGARGSPVCIAPLWRGDAPPVEAFQIAEARGVDLRPLDASDEATRERLLSFVWADQSERSERLERALALAQLAKPRVDKGEAVRWLNERMRSCSGSECVAWCSTRCSFSIFRIAISGRSSGRSPTSGPRRELIARWPTSASSGPAIEAPCIYV
jgi:hypothetical protein